MPNFENYQVDDDGVCWGGGVGKGGKHEYQCPWSKYHSEKLNPEYKKFLGII